MVIDLHRCYIKNAMKEADSQESFEIAQCLLLMYDEGLIKIDFSNDGEMLFGMRENITKEQFKQVKQKYVGTVN